MIHDKDYILRMVQQLSEALSRLLLGNNEGIPQEEELAIETQIRNVFKCSKKELSEKPFKEILSEIQSKPESHQIGYYEVLGHFFFLQNRIEPSGDLAQKAKNFYQIWLEESKIFSLVVMQRLGELNQNKTGEI